MDAQSNPSQGDAPHGNAPQGYHAQGNPPQGNPPQGYHAQGNPPQGYHAQGNPPQGNPPQGYQAQGQPSQGYHAQGNPPQGYLPQFNQPQDNPSHGNQAQGYAHGFQGNQPPYHGNQYSYMNQAPNPPFGGPSHDGGPANKTYFGYQAFGGGFPNSYGSSNENNNNQQPVGFAQTANQAADVHGNPFTPRGPDGEPSEKVARISTTFAAARNQAMQGGANAEEDRKRRERIDVMKKQVAYNAVVIAQVQKVKDAHDMMVKNMHEAWEGDTGISVTECKKTLKAAKRLGKIADGDLTEDNDFHTDPASISRLRRGAANYKVNYNMNHLVDLAYQSRIPSAADFGQPDDEDPLFSEEGRHRIGRDEAVRRHGYDYNEWQDTGNDGDIEDEEEKESGDTETEASSRSMNADERAGMAGVVDEESDSEEALDEELAREEKRTRRPGDSFGYDDDGGFVRGDDDVESEVSELISSPDEYESKQTRKRGRVKAKGRTLARKRRRETIRDSDDYDVSESESEEEESLENSSERDD